MNFHNPYTFIPAADRDPDGPFGDALPAGHGWLQPDRWTGRLAVTLTTVSPLLIPDAGEDVDGTPGHRRHGTRVESDPDGNPRVYLPPTSVKGMLRAAYEAVTNSRMGVFASRAPLAYRADSRSALKLKPVMLKLDADGAPQAAVTWPWLNYRSHGTIREVAIPAVAIPAYTPGSVPPCQYPDGTAPAHGDRATAWLELIERTPSSPDQKAYLYWRAVTMWRQTEPAQHRPADLGTRSNGRHRAVGVGALVVGQVHRTNQNIKRKHDERLFIIECLQADPGVVVEPGQELSLDETGTVWGRYRTLLENYRDAHVTDRRDDIWKRPGGKQPWETIPAGRTTDEYAWSRHLYDVADPDGLHELTTVQIAEQGADALTPSRWITCYASVDGKKITELVPVLISRRLHHTVPWDLLSGGTEPAAALGELSPADRVFGWVRQPRPDERERTGDGRDQAARGALRVGPVYGPLQDDALQRLNLPLEILGAPKPSQGRFYVGARGPDGLPAPLRPGTAKDKAFSEGNIVRGRKVYPHQPKDAGYWKSDAGKPDYRRLDDVTDTQNRTITSWVRPGQQFRFALDVRNLSDLELGALLWLLDPQRLGEPDRPGHHRLGLGKPLGFGSVRVELDTDGHDLRRGNDWADDFRTLGQAQPTTTWSGLAETFAETFGATPAGRKILDTIRATAAGFAPDHVVHYPRQQPRRDPDRPSYEWFVANEKFTRKPLGDFGTPLQYRSEPAPQRGNSAQTPPRHTPGHRSPPPDRGRRQAQ
ncbi:MAG: hypothetical protein QOE51_4985 [Actinoplanes sp.]|jgi:CRISPR-associated protein (TIGR03986 family)|nr:hypothetical protein [Actinoplanes sp.]